MGTHPLLIGVLAMAAVLPQQSESPCTGIDLVVGASRPAVRGVVERARVASNPLPWGGSISAVTRVWGGVLVERWATGSELGECADPSDRPTYQAVGIDQMLVPAGGVISGLELAALTSQFGPPVVFEPSGFDRFMAWARVFPSVPVVVVLSGWAVVALVRRRRRRRADAYLF